MLNNNCPARQTDINPNLDTDITSVATQEEGRNLIESTIVSRLLLFLSQIHPCNHSQTMRGPSIHLSIIGSSASTLLLLNQKRKAIKGREKEQAGHVFPHHDPYS